VGERGGQRSIQRRAVAGADRDHFHGATFYTGHIFFLHQACVGQLGQDGVGMTLIGGPEMLRIWKLAVGRFTRIWDFGSLFSGDEKV
jgi:hypothetical protein